MAENYIMLNGKRIDLTAEQIETLVGKKEKDPFERVEKGEDYYFIGTHGKPVLAGEMLCDGDEGCYSTANYCTDKELMEQRALHETLNRLLWRYSMQHGGRKINWETNSEKWSVFYDHLGERFDAYFSFSEQRVSAIYFKDQATAEAAIEEIVKPFMEQHPEFRW